MKTEKIVAMAVAAIAEENKTEANRVIVRSFREMHQSSLEQYLADHRISWHQYQLEDAKA